MVICRKPTQSQSFSPVTGGLEAATRLEGRLLTGSQVRKCRHRKASTCPSQDVGERGFEFNFISLQSPALNQEPRLPLRGKGMGKEVLKRDLERTQRGKGWVRQKQKKGNLCGSWECEDFPPEFVKGVSAY